MNQFSIVTAFFFLVFLTACSVEMAPETIDDSDQGCSIESCEFGFKSNEDKRELCECIEGESCVQVYPSPVVNPHSGECTQFSNPCNIPSDWTKTCGELL